MAVVSIGPGGCQRIGREPGDGVDEFPSLVWTGTIAGPDVLKYLARLVVVGVWEGLEH